MKSVNQEPDLRLCRTTMHSAHSFIAATHCLVDAGSKPSLAVRYSLAFDIWPSRAAMLNSNSTDIASPL